MQYRNPPKRDIHGILLLDKPSGVSSHTAVQMVRKYFNAEKTGHTGTLDPLASGLLPLCFGKATALCGQLLDATKRYTAHVKLGVKTSTGDAAGEVLSTSQPAAITEAQLQASLAGFMGEGLQVPPMHSALKKDGVRLYSLAHEGLEIDRSARPISIYHFALLSYADGIAVLDIKCSKGTYIRTLAEDWAASLGQVAHLTALRRTEVGPFPGDLPAHPLASLAQCRLADLDALIAPARSALIGWRFVKADADDLNLLDFGRLVAKPHEVEGPVAIEGEQGQLLGLGEINPHGYLQPRRWFGLEGI